MRTRLHTKFPANREINREFFRIRPFTAIFVSDQPADSIAYSRIPYATKQGIFRDISGKFFEETGKFNRAVEQTAKPPTRTKTRDRVADRC
jgi:hypothetical protein